MKTLSHSACTLAAIFAAHFSSHATVTVFQDDLVGFTAVVGLLPVIDFDGIARAFQFFGPPALNRVGQVVFEAELVPPSLAPRGIYLGDIAGGPTTVLLDDSSMFNFTAGDFTKIPDINDAGTIVFFANRDAGGEGLFSISSAGGPITTVAETNGAFTNFYSPSINNAGTVAFRAGTGGSGEGVFRASSTGGPPSLVADTTGAFTDFLGVTINNAGTVAFRAGLNTGGDGIFTGPDASRDRVIGYGDTLFTSTVTRVEFVKEGLNDLGQIAFQYTLADGRIGIAVATPTGILRILSITRPAAATIRLAVEGIPTLRHTILATDDLRQPFTAIGTRIAAPDGTFQFDEATAVPQRFYRVTLP